MQLPGRRNNDCKDTANMVGELDTPVCAEWHLLIVVIWVNTYAYNHNYSTLQVIKYYILPSVILLHSVILQTSHNLKNYSFSPPTGCGSTGIIFWINEYTKWNVLASQMERGGHQRFFWKVPMDFEHNDKTESKIPMYLNIKECFNLNQTNLNMNNESI